MNNESEKKAIQIYNYYTAIRLHFTTDYDFFRYHGRVRSIKPETFDRRSDKRFFYQLAKDKRAKQIILASITNDTNEWIGVIAGKKGEDAYFQLKKKWQTLSRTFTQDLAKMDNDFKTEMSVINGQHPKLLRRYLGGQIQIETLIILDSLVNILSIWDKKILEEFVWPDINRRCNKLKGFMQFDEDIMKHKFLHRYAENGAP